jgi:hypothetical protein
MLTFVVRACWHQREDLGRPVPSCDCGAPLRGVPCGARSIRGLANNSASPGRAAARAHPGTGPRTRFARRIALRRSATRGWPCAPRRRTRSSAQANPGPWRQKVACHPADHQQTRGAAVVPAGAGTIPGRPPCRNALRVLKPLPVVHRGLAPGAWTGAGGCRRRHAAPEAARPLQADNGCQLSAASSHPRLLSSHPYVHRHRSRHRHRRPGHRPPRPAQLQAALSRRFCRRAGHRRQRGRATAPASPSPRCTAPTRPTSTSCSRAWR